jgi:hypothetical protein
VRKLSVRPRLTLRGRTFKGLRSWSGKPLHPPLTDFPIVADLGEFVLPYTAVRAAPDPPATLLAFFQSTYDAAADLGGWDRPSLETAQPSPP